ncbi:ACP S-malonyltransferase [Pelagibacteraceae bacterium]|nr:ACP S-malonyltransferase [Pelagibacteraceae bacterium]
MTIALLFPGQGSQFVGMGKDFYNNYDSSKSIYNELDNALNRPLTDIIFNGSEEDMLLTTNSQPAIMATSIAILRAIQSEKLLNINDVSYVAGHSLGEYSALVATKSIRFNEAVKLLKTRSEAMQKSMPVGTGGMVAIIGTPVDQIEKVIPSLMNYGKIYVANDNSDGQVVLSGEVSAINHICADFKKYNFKRAIKLPVSAPFHCELIQSAANLLKKEIDNYDFKEFEFPLVSNVTASVCNANEIKNLLIDQVVCRVRWRECLRYIIDKGTTNFIEIGPGNILTNLVKRMDKKINAFSISTIKDLEKLRKLI